MKMRTRMLLGTSLLFVLCACALAVALMGMQGARERFEHFLRNDEALLQASMGMYADGLQSGQALRNIVMDPANPTAYKNLERATADFLDRARKAREVAPPGSADRKLLQDLLAKREALGAIQSHIVQTARTDQAAAMVAINKDETPAWRTIRQALLDFSAAKNKSVEASKADIARYTGQVLVVSLGVMGLALLGGAITMFLVVRQLLRDLGGEPSYVRDVASRIADGDLTVQVEVGSGDRGSVVFAMRQMALRLRDLVGEVAAGAHAVADGSSQIAQANLDLSQRTEEQASTLEETASSMEQLTSTVTQNADHARQASELAVRASEVARQGGKVVGDVVSTMSGISEASGRIAEIIGVIDGIAFQTNILALNAAVEAARAGEQGRGFAVVAAEVRTLAQRSASAAKEIKGLIGDSVVKVEAGTRLADSAGGTMGDLVAAVQKVSERISEIAAASREQSAGIGQVGTAVAQMDQVVQQNASMVEEAAAATDALKGQAEALLRTVARFRLAQDQGPKEAQRVPERRDDATRPVRPIRLKPSAPPPASVAAVGTSSPRPAEGWSTF
jgi:methyl-accepting chemotaxis protein